MQLAFAMLTPAQDRQRQVLVVAVKEATRRQKEVLAVAEIVPEDYSRADLRDLEVTRLNAVAALDRFDQQHN